MIAADPTPNTDYPFDPVWTELTHVESPGVGVALQDVSSKLNANWVQKTILEKTALAALLRPGFTAQDLQQRREDKGISTDIAAEYGDLIKDEALSRYFTGYGYANLNTTDEFALRKLYEVRMGDSSGAEMFRTRWQQAMIQKKVLKRTDLREFLGLDYDRLFPVFNVEPVFQCVLSGPPRALGAALISRLQGSKAETNGTAHPGFAAQSRAPSGGIAKDDRCRGRKPDLQLPRSCHVVLEDHGFQGCHTTGDHRCQVALG